MEIMTIPEIVQFQAANGVADPQGVAGVALPFNVEVDRPGIAIDATGQLVFFDTRLYDAHAFDWQIATLNSGTRPLMWQHGDGGGITGIPIGNVRGMRALPDKMTFSASLNETDVAEQVKQVISDGVVRDVSAAVQTLEFTIETREDRTVQVITRADFLHVALVVHAEFADTKIVEVFSRLEQASGIEADSAGREHKARSEDTVESLQTQIGQLRAQVNDLEHGQKTASLAVETEKS